MSHGKKASYQRNQPIVKLILLRSSEALGLMMQRGASEKHKAVHRKLPTWPRLTKHLGRWTKCGLAGGSVGLARSSWPSLWRALGRSRLARRCWRIIVHGNGSRG